MGKSVGEGVGVIDGREDLVEIDVEEVDGVAGGVEVAGAVVELNAAVEAERCVRGDGFGEGEKGERGGVDGDGVAEDAGAASVDEVSAQGDGRRGFGVITGSLLEKVGDGGGASDRRLRGWSDDADVVAMRIVESRVAARGRDHDLVVAAGGAVRPGMEGKLVVERGALEAAGGDAESGGGVVGGLRASGVDEAETGDGLRFGRLVTMTELVGWGRGDCGDLEVGGVQIEDGAAQRVKGDKVDDDFAGGDVEGEEAGFALGRLLGFRGWWGRGSILPGSRLEEQGREQEGWEHRSPTYNQMGTGERVRKFQRNGPSRRTRFAQFVGLEPRICARREKREVLRHCVPQDDIPFHGDIRDARGEGGMAGMRHLAENRAMHDARVMTDVPGAVEEIHAGRMVVVVDDEDRENEGDLTLAAEHVTPEAINFMARYGRGLICLTLTEERADYLRLGPMTQENSSRFGTAFTETIEAREGVTTGISAADRAHTIQVAIDPRSTAQDLARPGHVFPLRARKGGVLVRAGQTEASVDLARMAGLIPAGVICEIMKRRRHDGAGAGPDRVLQQSMG